jgi:hypothetical protein
MTRVSVRLVPHLIASTAVIGTLAACSGSQGPAGPVLTGNRAGVVYLFDQFGGALASDSGMTVVANPGSVTSVSNTAGQYTLTNLKTGVYTISFTASGFGTFVQPRVQFVGGGTIEVAPIDFSQQSTGVITSLTATPNVAGDTLTYRHDHRASPWRDPKHSPLLFHLVHAISRDRIVYRHDRQDGLRCQRLHVSVDRGGHGIVGQQFPCRHHGVRRRLRRQLL